MYLLGTFQLPTCQTNTVLYQLLLSHYKPTNLQYASYHRYFSSWKHKGAIETHSLPHDITTITGQTTCPFGDGVLCLSDSMLACETCEELFTPQAPHISLALAGVEIISNGSGSHHQLRKLDTRMDLIRGATAKVISLVCLEFYDLSLIPHCS